MKTLIMSPFARATKIPFDISLERVVFYSLDPNDLTAAKEKLGELVKTVDSKDYENESPLKSKITIETTKSVSEKELLTKMWEKLQEIEAVQARSAIEIEISFRARNDK